MSDPIQVDRLRRLMAKVNYTPYGCWEWHSIRNQGGYGIFHHAHNAGGPAHRWSYRLLVGEIPEGFQIHHECRNRSCVNPSHLVVLSVQQHMKLRRTGSPWAGLPIPEGKLVAPAARTHCPKGHPYDAFNTRRMRNGARRCRRCLVEYKHVYRAGVRKRGREQRAVMKAIIAELALRIKRRKQKEEAVAKLPPLRKDTPLVR
jgi:hypothetical protein